MMQIELNEQQAIALYRILCRWESTGKLTVSVGEETRLLWDLQCVLEKELEPVDEAITKDLFEECSRTQLRVKDDEMILPRGVTGFWSVNAAPLPLLEEKAFCQMCYSIALENGGTVTEVDTDTAIRNFYSAKLSRYDQSVFLLQNIHYPYAAFAQRDTSGGFIWISQPEWLQLPEGSVRFLSPSELTRDWHDLRGELSPEELEQIHYWNPQTVGEIVFNTWD